MALERRDTAVWRIDVPAGNMIPRLWSSNGNKNSSGDEIANVNFLRRYDTYVLQNTKKENLLRLTN